MQKIKGNFGKRIKRLRDQLKLSQENFAGRVDVTQPYIAALEAGKRSPSPSLVHVIAARYGVAEDWLRYGRGRLTL